MAAWGDSEDSSSEDEQKKTTNICFMAQEDEVSSSSSQLDFDFDVDELLEAYNQLMIEFKKLHKKRKETNLLNEKIGK